MTTVDTCAHPAEALSTLKGGGTLCTACQTRDPVPAAPLKLVCGVEPSPKPGVPGGAANVPAVRRLLNTAAGAGWLVELIDDSPTDITVRLGRDGEHGHVAWKLNDEGAWRFSTCLIAGQRFGAREIPERLARVNEPPVDKPRHLAVVPPLVLGPVLTPEDVARLAPPPPSAPAPAGGVMPMGTLASFMAAAPRATPVNGNTEWANRYADELRAIIYHAGRNSARSLQIHLGPSELGVPCDRQVAGKLAGIPSTNHVVNPWPSILGTAGHAWLADAFKAENARHGLRWVPENRVIPHPDHSGTADLYDGAEQAVVDWKILAADKIDSIAAKGPSVQYQIQLLLYGRGYRNLGLPVRRVALVALPRTKSTLDGMYVWDHEWTQADDDAIEEVFKLTAIRKAWADEIRAGRPLLSVPATPDHDTCYFCPFYRPQAAHDGGIGCPGTAQ